MTYLDFKAAMSESTSWRRANPTDALIERTGRTTYRVFLTDGADSHTVTFGKERGGYVGHCDCKGHEFGKWPCAHLCTLRKAEFASYHDLRGRPIKARSTLGKSEPDPEIRADGGESPLSHAAGSDGEVFGRPEDML